jgi:hypothetical protein
VFVTTDKDGESETYLGKFSYSEKSGKLTIRLLDVPPDAAIQQVSWVVQSATATQIVLTDTSSGATRTWRRY